MLRELHERGVPLYALTNFSAEKFPLVRDQFDWFGWFRGIVISGVEGLVKPDLRIYRVLLTRYGLDPATIAFLDDTPANVVAAEAAGMTGLHFTGPGRLRADLGRLGLLDG